MQAKKMPAKHFSYDYKKVISLTGMNERLQNLETTGSYCFDEVGILVNGELSGQVVAQCARCVREVVFPLHIAYTAVYKEVPDEENGEYFIENNTIDLSKMLFDEISLHMPLQFLCSEECKGLCPVCGKNLNTEGCACSLHEKESALNSFAKLKGLFE